MKKFVLDLRQEEAGHVVEHEVGLADNLAVFSGQLDHHFFYFINIKSVGSLAT